MDYNNLSLQISIPQWIWTRTLAASPTDYQETSQLKAHHKQSQTILTHKKHFWC